MTDGKGLESLFDLSFVEVDAQSVARELAKELSKRRKGLVECCASETGLGASDAEESVDGSIAFLKAFKKVAAPPTSVPSLGGRAVEIHSAPWGTVVAILPQNAFLFLGLVCLLHALDCGNRIVLRAPSNCAGTADSFRDALRLAGIQESQCVLIDVGAKDLLDAFFASPAPGLVHYFGGSGRIPDLMSSSFRAGKGLIADGEGNAWVYVDEGCDPSEAARVLTEGAIRYNGQTCTSLNGAIIHPSIYDLVLPLLRKGFKGAQVGALNDPQSAQWCLDLATRSEGKILIGGTREDATAAPTLVERPNPASELVREGLFGPVLWVAPGTASDFRRLWQTNRFPLCAAVLGPSVEPCDWTTLGNLARLVVNGDPSLEDPLEPWGGYPSSGNSPVSDWHSKYRRTVQVDRP